MRLRGTDLQEMKALRTAAIAHGRREVGVILGRIITLADVASVLFDWVDRTYLPPFEPAACTMLRAVALLHCGNDGTLARVADAGGVTALQIHGNVISNAGLVHIARLTGSHRWIFRATATSWSSLQSTMLASPTWCCSSASSR